MTLAELFKTGRADIVLRRPRHIGEGGVLRTASGRSTTPYPREDYASPRKTTNTIRRLADWLRENARAEAQSRGLYCCIGDGYAGGDGLTTAEADEGELLLWGLLTVDGRYVGLPESWDARGGYTDEEIAACPLVPTPDLIRRLLVELLTGGAVAASEAVA